MQRSSLFLCERMVEAERPGNEVFESYYKLRVLFDQCDDQINTLTERFYRDAGKYSC